MPKLNLNKTPAQLELVKSDARAVAQVLSLCGALVEHKHAAAAKAEAVMPMLEELQVAMVGAPSQTSD